MATATADKVINTRRVTCTACDLDIIPGFGAVVTMGRQGGFETYAVVHYVADCVRVITSDDNEIVGTV